MNDYAPTDADGHIMETDDELRSYLRPPFEERHALTALFPSLDGWLRSTRKLSDSKPCLQKWRPHKRPTLEEFFQDVPRFRAREDLSEAVKKSILRDNCIQFYSLKEIE